jgi:RNA polymerase sigma factor (sigma-70 family)
MKRPFEEVVDSHGPTVLRVCRAILGPQDAEDAWADTFVSAMRAYPDLPDDVNIEAWLVTVAHRKAIDVLRARKRRAVPFEHVPDITGDQDAFDAEAADLWNAVHSLPLKQRQAIALHYLAGIPYTQVAETTGSSTEATRRAAADGIANLRQLYTNTPAE